MSYLTAGLRTAGRIGESAAGLATRTLNARLFPQSATKVRKGEAVNDIIGLNAKTPGRYVNPPFPSSKGAPWASPSSDPRAAVTGAARREELIQKRKVAKKPKKGSLDRTLNTAQPGSNAWLNAWTERYPGM